jgi:hypothetical protein
MGKFILFRRGATTYLSPPVLGSGAYPAIVIDAPRDTAMGLVYRESR